jgi:hypothetical protein
MRQAATQELYSYWNGLRGARLAPERSEIDPAAIRHVLADTMILEADDERQFPVRISGTRLNALFLGEQKGNSFVGLFAAQERRAVSAMILSALDDARPVVAGLTATPDDDMPNAGDLPAHLELLLLPLRHHGTTHSRLLGALTPAAIPSWLGLRRAACLRLVAMRHVDDGEPGPVLRRLSHGTVAPFSPIERARNWKSRRRAFLVLPGGRF